MKKLYLTSPEKGKPIPPFINHLELTECGSTNDSVFNNLESLREYAPLLVSADEQTSGRGREGREWYSSGRGGLYISFLIRLFNREGLTFLSIAAGTAVAEALLAETEIKTRIKWPNDIEITGRKTGGILVENRISGDETLTVTGIGLNVNSAPDNSIPGFRDRVSFIREAAGREIDITRLRKRITEHFLFYISELEQARFRPLLHAYSGFLKHSPGDAIGFHSAGSVVQGTFKEINRRGGLVMILEGGEEKTFFSGEIV